MVFLRISIATLLTLVLWDAQAIVHRHFLLYGFKTVIHNQDYYVALTVQFKEDASESYYVFSGTRQSRTRGTLIFIDKSADSITFTTDRRELEVLSIENLAGNIPKAYLMSFYHPEFYELTPVDKPTINANLLRVSGHCNLLK